MNVVSVARVNSSTSNAGEADAAAGTIGAGTGGGANMVELNVSLFRLFTLPNLEDPGLVKPGEKTNEPPALMTRVEPPGGVPMNVAPPDITKSEVEVIEPPGTIVNVTLGPPAYIERS